MKDFRNLKSILTFEKWTKKMSKNDLSKMSLLTENFCDDIQNLSSHIKANKNILKRKKNNYFLKSFFISYIYGNSGKL